LRLWTLHPKYLDAKGLVAAWREALLASAVLQGNTKGYKNHPQLDRFKTSDDPISAINIFLKIIYQESKARKYNFDGSKIMPCNTNLKIEVTKGQVDYEWKLLKTKLSKRDKDKLKKIERILFPEVHPLFKVIEGSIENWEKVLPLK